MRRDSTLTLDPNKSIHLFRLYMKAAELGAATMGAERKEDLNGEATLSGGNLCAASIETEENTTNGNPSQAV